MTSGTTSQAKRTSRYRKATSSPNTCTGRSSKTALPAIPVWHSYYPDDYPNFAGYETWPDLVAVDPTGQWVGKTVSVSYLYGVLKPGQTPTALPTPWPTVTASAKVYGLQDFYYHQVTKEDWQSFDETTRRSSMPQAIGPMASHSVRVITW